MKVKKLPLLLLGAVVFSACSRNSVTPTTGTTSSVGLAVPNTYLTYTAYSAVPNQSAEVFTVELNKTGLNQLTHLASGGRGFSGYSVFSGTSLAVFSSDSGSRNSFHLYKSPVSGGPSTAITSGVNVSDVFPSVSPDGRHIAFARSSQTPGQLMNTNSLMTSNIDGSDVTLLKLNVGSEGHSSWSPDGSKIFFDSADSTGIPHVFVVKADGTGIARLTNTAFGEEYPAVSPDGKGIALATFADATHGGQDISLMNADGSNLHKLTSLGASVIAHMPCWSPSGKFIFFSSYDRLKAEPAHIFSINADGTNLQQFTTGKGEEYPAVGFVTK